MMEQKTTEAVFGVAGCGRTALCMALAFRNDILDILGKFRRRR